MLVVLVLFSLSFLFFPLSDFVILTFALSRGRQGLQCKLRRVVFRTVTTYSGVQNLRFM